MNTLQCIQMMTIILNAALHHLNPPNTQHNLPKYGSGLKVGSHFYLMSTIAIFIVCGLKKAWQHLPFRLID